MITFEDNLNPLGHLFYAGSTMVCRLVSLIQSGPAMGSQIGKHGTLQIVKSRGFKRLEEQHRHHLILYKR